jgi:sialate O-acetylesterase
MNLLFAIRSVGAVFLLLSAIPVQAAVILFPPFASNMVIQRNQPIGVYGQATPGSVLHLQLGDEKVDATVDDQGNWKATLPALPAGGPLTLTIEGDGEITLQNILVGDVWLASGQSNMEFPMSTSFGSGPGILDGTTEIAAADHPDIRFFRQKRLTSPTPLSKANGAWDVCTPATVGKCSAVAYYFAQELEAREHIPIGLICSYAGGTPIEAWTPPDALAGAPGYASFSKRWQAAVASYPRWKVEYDKNVAAQKAAMEDAKKNGTAAPPSHYISPPAGSPDRAPGALYNAMISPFTPIPITGIIWYQGEDNLTHPTEYRGFFPALITSWRTAWKQSDLPFIFVQLSSFRPRAPQPGPSNWAELRDAQNGALHLPNTGMAVSLDLGEAANIHYVNKKPVGLRLAAAALAMVYGEKIEGSSPLYDSMDSEGGDAIRIKFSHASSGLKTSDGGVLLQGFTVAGNDQIFYAADAILDGSSVMVRSAQVPRPVAVRYAWADNPAANLVSAEGLPVGTFRTDQFEH